jgi:RHS repeat-associated protein
MTKDLNKGISNISYNLLNLPQQIDINSSLAVATNKYSYSAGGEKLRVQKTYNSSIGEAPIEASVMLLDGESTASTVTQTTDYVGNKIFENGTLERILVDGGYIKDGVYYFYETDHLGSNRLTVSQTGTASDRSDYYPYGMQMAHNDPNQGATQQIDGYAKTSFKFSGKELDVMHGLNLYDSQARMQDPTLGGFTTANPMAEKYYYQISPYAYAGNNPIRNIDINGDSVTVLNMGTGTDQHMAMLIQDDNGKWQYFSLNGDWVYKFTDGTMCGKPYHDTGEKTFDSPQEFLQSTYNSKGDEQQIDDNTVNNYGFAEAYILPTTSKQDESIRKTFLASVEEGYSLTGNQCSQAVQKSLKAAGIETRETFNYSAYPMAQTKNSYKYNPYLPSSAFHAIIRNNSNGQFIKKK